MNGWIILLIEMVTLLRPRTGTIGFALREIYSLSVMI